MKRSMLIAMLSAFGAVTTACGARPHSSFQLEDADIGPQGKVTLFADGQYNGRPVEIEKGKMTNLGSLQFNDQASSISVPVGLIALVCVDKDLVGECRTIVGPKQISWGHDDFNDKASSIIVYGKERVLVGNTFETGRRIEFWRDAQFRGKPTFYGVGTYNPIAAEDNDSYTSLWIPAHMRVTLGVDFLDGKKEVIVTDDNGQAISYLGDLADQISSLQVEDLAATGTAPDAGDLGNSPAIGYENGDQSGRKVAIDKDKMINLTDLGFNDRMSGLALKAGYTAVVFTDVDGQGEARQIVGPTYVTWGNNNNNFNDKVSSILVFGDERVGALKVFDTGRKVELFHDIHFRGKGVQYAAGTYNPIELADNDAFTSMWIPPHMRVTLGVDFLDGYVEVLETGVNGVALSYIGASLNDKISSIKVEDLQQ
jgi:hypothetical protein